MGRIMGKQSIAFDNPPYILEGASIVGQKEGERTERYTRLNVFYRG